MIEDEVYELSARRPVFMVADFIPQGTEAREGIGTISLEDTSSASGEILMLDFTLPALERMIAVCETLLRQAETLG